MRTLRGVAIGITIYILWHVLGWPWIGYIFSGRLGLRLPKRLDAYANRPLPADYAGPKMRTWARGELTEGSWDA